MLLKRTFLNCNKIIQRCLSSAPSQKVATKYSENLVLGNEEDKLHDALKHPDYFNVQDLVTIKDLFDNRVHYGHKITSLNPKMKQYLFGSRLGHLIFDLDITTIHLTKALNFVAHIAYRNGIILFVSKNPSITLLVEKTAAECKEYALTREWRLGTFTNSSDIFRSVVRLPDLCIFLNTLEENGFQHKAINEAAKMLIPTVGVVDTNCDPNLITFPVPGNDDSIVSISYYCNLFKKAILRGKKKRIEDKLDNNVEVINQSSNECEKSSS